jgi:DNA-binding IclR family transcriptional regulator
LAAVEIGTAPRVANLVSSAIGSAKARPTIPKPTKPAKKKTAIRTTSESQRQPADRDQRHIQSVNVGFRLIQCLIESRGPLSLKELAEQSGLKNGHAYLYMTSFLQLGLVRQDGNTSRYDLGPLAFDLGLAAVQRADLIELAKDTMYELHASTGQSVFLCVWGNRGATIVWKVDGQHGTPMQVMLGFVHSLLETATGRIFLAYLPRWQTQALVTAELDAGPQLSDVRLTPASLEALVSQILKDGASTTGTHRRDGFGSIAVPIFDHASSLRASITLTGLRTEMEENGAKYRQALLAAAATVSERFGFRINTPLSRVSLEDVPANTTRNRKAPRRTK